MNTLEITSLTILPKTQRLQKVLGSLTLNLVMNYLPSKNASFSRSLLTKLGDLNVIT